MAENWFEKTDDYLSGNMSPEESAQFEKAMTDNKELAEDAAIYRMIGEEMVYAEQFGEADATLKKSLSKACADFLMAKQRSNKKKLWFRLAAAAAITGIIALGIIWVIQNGDKNDEHFVDTEQREILYAQNFVPDAVPELTEGPLFIAFDLYQKKEYAEASSAFDHPDNTIILRGQSEDSFLQAYYKGLCLMLTDSAATAIQTLEAALTMEPGGLMLVKTQWYLALAHLKAGEIKKTLALLEIIAVNNTEAFYREKALKMIRQLTKDI